MRSRRDRPDSGDPGVRGRRDREALEQMNEVMQDPMDKIEEEVHHISNHVHWWQTHNGMHHEDLIKTLECIEADATRIVEETQQWLLEIHS